MAVTTSVDKPWFTLQRAVSPAAARLIRTQPLYLILMREAGSSSTALHATPTSRVHSANELQGVRWDGAHLHADDIDMEPAGAEIAELWLVHVPFDDWALGLVLGRMPIGLSGTAHVNFRWRKTALLELLETK